jgi:ketosteroid isomerase-like protein
VAALAGHVRRIVFLSASSVRDGASPAENGVWGQVEQVIERSGTEWVFLRAGGFAANTLAWADRIRAGGVVRWVYGEAARSLIHERDIADVGVRALTDDQHAGAKYVLTGPASITQADQARIIGEVTGLPVGWEEAAPEEIRGQLAASTGDPAFADHALAYWASLIAQPELVTRTVAEITGAPARTFRTWVQDHAGDFRPRSPAEVVSRYVSLLRRGDLAAALKLLAPDVVRTAPVEGTDRLRGVEAIAENSRRQTAGYQIRGVEIDGPYPHEDRFAVRFAFDEVHLPTGQQATIEKMSVYAVRDSAIVSEDVYYHTPPHAV